MKARFRSVFFGVAVLIAVIATSTMLLAGTTIPTLYNTGVNAAGVPLPNGMLGDPHYALISVPSGSTTTILVRNAAGYPMPPYVGLDALSAWIGPDNSYPGWPSAFHGPVGYYDYQTTFDLTGFYPSTASITGGWTTDNGGVAIFLNGADTGNPGTSDVQYKLGFVPFTITSGFRSGINTLDFIVYNSLVTEPNPNPTALRVEMTGTAVPTPEPATLALLGTGLTAAGAMLRKLRS